MSTLQVSNLHFESTGNNRLQYTGSNGYNLVAGGSTVATVNTTAVDFPLQLGTNTITTNTINTKTITANGSNGTAGQSLISGGSGNVYWSTPIASSGDVKTTAFSSNGTWSPTNTSIKSIKVTVVGGGGGGAKAGNNNTGPPGSTVIGGDGGAGGSGAVAINTFPAPANPSITSPISVVVGLGGANGTAGSTGGTSSFGSLISATGGVGGTAGTNANYPNNGTDGSPGPAGTNNGGIDLILATAGTPEPGTPARHQGGKNIFTISDFFEYNGSGGPGGTNTGYGKRGADGFVIIEEYY